MSSSLRRGVLLILLLGAIGAAVWVSMPEDSSSSMTVDVAERSNSAAKRRADMARRTLTASPVAVSLAIPERAPMDAGDNNPFGTKSWFVPPPPPPPAPPAAPSAPPLPFTYAGKVEQDDGSWAYVLVNGEQSYIVRSGETIDSSYRLEGVKDNNLIIEYTPLGIQQAIVLGSE